MIGYLAAVVDDREGLEGDDLGRFVDGCAVEASLALRTVGGWWDNVRFNAPTSHRGRRRAGVGGDSRRTLPASAPEPFIGVTCGVGTSFNMSVRVAEVALRGASWRGCVISLSGKAKRRV